MSVDLEQLQNQLDEALRRIQRIEQRLQADEQAVSRWQFLVARPHPWRRQLSIKGRNLTVGQLVSNLRANRLTEEQAGEEFDLPLSAIREALDYYRENRALIELEAAEERRRLGERGYALEPKNLPR